MKYFEVIVEIKTETEGKKGAVSIKTVKEAYLVDAHSCTEAEARIVETFSKSGFMQDYEVVSVKGSKVVEVIEAPIVKGRNLTPLKNANQLAKEKDDSFENDEAEKGEE